MTQQVLDRPITAETATAPETAPEEAPFPPLTAADRCDGVFKGNGYRGTCGAQAFIRVVLASGRDLVFCGHCFAEQAADRAVPEHVRLHAGTHRTLSNRKVLQRSGRVYSQYGDLKPTAPTTPKREGF